MGYIVKPVQQEELQKVLDRVTRINKAQRMTLYATQNKPEKDVENIRQHISAKSRKGMELVPIENIFCFIADQKYVTVVHSGGEVLIDDTLKDLEREFPERFVRVHRNALIALNYIVGIEKDKAGRYEVKLKGSNFRPMVSRRHLSELKKLLSSL